MIIYILSFALIVTLAITIVFYLRFLEIRRLDRMALQNLLSDQEKAHYLLEYKKWITAKIIYESFAEEKSDIQVAREVIKGEREKC